MKIKIKYVRRGQIVYRDPTTRSGGKYLTLIVGGTFAAASDTLTYFRGLVFDDTLPGHSYRHSFETDVATYVAKSGQFVDALYHLRPDYIVMVHAGRFSEEVVNWLDREFAAIRRHDSETGKAK